MARRTRTRSVGKGDLGKLFAAVALVIATAIAASAGLYLWLTAPRPPARDQTTFCPTDGPRAITVMLLDTSDPLPEATKEDAIRRLTDIADGLPDYALLDIRILDPAYPAGRQVFFLCNPGDGKGLNEFTGNPRTRSKEVARAISRSARSSAKHKFGAKRERNLSAPRHAAGNCSRQIRRQGGCGASKDAGDRLGYDRKWKGLLTVSGRPQLSPLSGHAGVPQIAHRPQRCAGPNSVRRAIHETAD